MELKVWVDGIQRVVCGANYSTTCQDVVLALAHAMGRTGRFTLVEKWRETERPLTPGECPLQALHKWGEYAGEVKFYLVQAETEKVQQKSHGSQPSKTTEKMDKFTHNFSPTPQPRTSVQSTSSDTVKRSSTFSGAHSPNYAHQPSSSYLPGKNQINPQHSHQNQKHYPQRPSPSQQQYQNNLQPVSEHVPSSKPRSSSQTRQQQRQQQPPHSTATLPSSFHSRRHLQNGDISTMSSTSSNNSSPRSPSQSAMRVTTPYDQAEPAIPISHSTDSRHTHPAQLPRSPEGRSERSLDHERQRGRPTTTQGSQQQFLPTPSQPPSSYPTPAPRGQRHRASPASPTSQQYQNLPPARPSRDPLPAGQSLSTFQVSRQRRSSSSGRRSSNDEPSHQRYNTHTPREVSAPSERAGTSHRDAPEGHSDHVNSITNPRKDIANLRDNGSIETFARNEALPLQPPPRAAKANRDFPNMAAKGFPSNNVNSRPITGDSLLPQFSQGVPVRSVGQKGSDDQQVTKLAPSVSSSNTLERTRRSQGDKVSFVESAFLRQQRSGRDVQNVSSSSFTRPQNLARDERFQQRETPPHDFSESNDYAEPPFHGQNGLQTSSRNASSHQTVLPMPTSPSPHSQDPARVSTPQSNNNVLSSPRRHSAFKEVSPRSSRPTSLSSPAGEPTGPTLVAYNLDEQNFNHYMGIHPRFSGPTQETLTHSRQTSLEIEEYDLDQNFPDVFSKETFSGQRGSSNYNNNQPHMEYVMDRQTNSTSEMEPEYMHLLRKVNMQQERIKVMEAQTNEISTEIDALEAEESNLNVKLNVVMSEMESLGKKEESYQLEVADLERVEWVNVVDGELKCEQDLKKQMASLKDGLTKMEVQFEEMKKEEAKKMGEIKQEEEKLSVEKEKAKKEEGEMEVEVAKAENSVSECDHQIAKRKVALDDLLSQIADIEKQLMSQETEAAKIESELHFENLKDFHAHPVPKENEPSPISDASELVVDTPPATPAKPGSDTGEAILKILEGGRSPRVSPALEETGGISSAQNMFKSALATKNPNGVWV